MSATSLKCIQILGQVVKHKGYYWRRLFSRDKAYFYIGGVWQTEYAPKRDGFSYCLIDKSTVGFRELVSRAVAILKWPKQLTPVEAVESIVQRNAIMCLVSDGEDIIAYEWFTPNLDYLPWLNAYVHLGDGDLYEHGAFVRESHREQGIFRSMRAWSYEHLMKRGFRRIVNAIVSWNTPSLRVNDHFGFRVIGHVHYGYIAGCRYFLTTVPADRLSYVGRMVFRMPHSQEEAAYV